MVPHEVVFFLYLVQVAHEKGRLNYRREREKNKDTLLALGWTPSAMFECVVGLEPDQALGMPWQNRNPAHDQERCCEFGTVIEGMQLYIKVTVVGDDEDVAGCVISFHFAEQPLDFPFVERGRRP